MSLKSLYDESFVFTIAAPRGSGKSHLVKESLKAGLLKKFDKIHIMSPSLSFNDDYEEFFNDKRVYLHMTPSQDDIRKIVEEQAHLVRDDVMKRRSKTFETGKLYRKAENINSDVFKEIKKPKKPPRILIILDDCIDSGIVDFKGVTDLLAERGRHLLISLIGITQRLSAMSRSIRINSTYISLFRPFSISEIEQFLEQFISKYNRKHLFSVVNSIFSEKYVFLIVDNKGNTPLNERFKIGTADDFITNNMKIVDMNESVNENEAGTSSNDVISHSMFGDECKSNKNSKKKKKRRRSSPIESDSDGSMKRRK